MFDRLPDLFGRDFAVGFFLPVAAFIAVSMVILSAAGIIPTSDWLTRDNALTTLTQIGLVSWFFGVLLLGANRQIYRLLEGYGTLNPLRLFKPLEEYRYNRLWKQLEDTQNDLSKPQSDREQARLREKEQRLSVAAATRYPHLLEDVLPTPFGNILRAFEVYPDIMYGADSIVLWSRLPTVMSKEYLDLLNSAKAQVDLWVNSSVLSLPLVADCIFIYGLTQRAEALVGVILAMVFSFMAYLSALDAAEQWGEYVKATFDIYLTKLRNVMGFAGPANKDEEWQFWDDFSQAISYRQHEWMPDRYRKLSQASPMMNDMLEIQDFTGEEMLSAEALPPEKTTHKQAR
jgi:hypothetical protein